MIFFSQDLNDKQFHLLSTLQLFLPLLFAIFYPKVGTILSYIGSVAGFFPIYFLPVLVHLKRRKMKLEKPIWVKALDITKMKYSPNENSQKKKEKGLMDVEEVKIADYVSPQQHELRMKRQKTQHISAWSQRSF